MLTPNIELPCIDGRIGENERLFLNRLCTCIKLKLTDADFTAQDLAKLITLSPGRLNRKLIYLTGFSTSNLIRYCRFQMAGHLLCNSDHTVKQIAWQSGFSGHTSFCRSFFLEFGCSPSVYRSRKSTTNDNKAFHWKFPLEDSDFLILMDLASRKSWLNQLLRMLIADLCRENLTVGQLAESIYLSASGLNRKIKETLGLTPQNLVRNLKLQRAAELLVAKFGSVAEIAIKAGFFDHAHFCRCFKLAFGCPPSAFIKGHEGEMSLLWLLNELIAKNGK